MENATISNKHSYTAIMRQQLAARQPNNEPQFSGKKTSTVNNKGLQIKSGKTFSAQPTDKKKSASATTTGQSYIGFYYTSKSSGASGSSTWGSSGFSSDYHKGKNYAGGGGSANIGKGGFQSGMGGSGWQGMGGNWCSGGFGN